MRLVKTSIPGYMKDPDTGAVINTNQDEYTQFLAMRAQQRENQKLNQELCDLRQQVAAIMEKLGK